MQTFDAYSELKKKNSTSKISNKMICILQT